MENKVKKALGNFVDEPDVEEINNAKAKEVVLNEREGLIERIDRVYVDKSGRQLLREQY